MQASIASSASSSRLESPFVESGDHNSVSAVCRCLLRRYVLNGVIIPCEMQSEAKVSGQ